MAKGDDGGAIPRMGQQLNPLYGTPYMGMGGGPMGGMRTMPQMEQFGMFGPSNPVGQGDFFNRLRGGANNAMRGGGTARARGMGAPGRMKTPENPARAIAAARGMNMEGTGFRPPMQFGPQMDMGTFRPIPRVDIPQQPQMGPPMQGGGMFGPSGQQQPQFNPMLLQMLSGNNRRMM